MIKRSSVQDSHAINRLTRDLQCNLDDYVADITEEYLHDQGFRYKDYESSEEEEEFYRAKTMEAQEELSKEFAMQIIETLALEYGLKIDFK